MPQQCTQRYYGGATRSPSEISNARRVYVRCGLDTAPGLAFRRPTGESHVLVAADHGDTSRSALARSRRSAQDAADRELAS